MRVWLNDIWILMWYILRISSCQKKAVLQQFWIRVVIRKWIVAWLVNKLSAPYGRGPQIFQDLGSASSFQASKGWREKFPSWEPQNIKGLLTKAPGICACQRYRNQRFLTVFINICCSKLWNPNIISGIKFKVAVHRTLFWPSSILSIHSHFTAQN